MTSKKEKNLGFMESFHVAEIFNVEQNTSKIQAAN
jgi:hypothetical protein